MTLTFRCEEKDLLSGRLTFALELNIRSDLEGMFKTETDMYSSLMEGGSCSNK